MVNSLTKYIEQSDILGRNEASELEILKEKYPFFQALHILIAKSHKNQNTFGFNKNLRIASMYAGDRRILYNFINYETEKSEIVKIETSPENETVENNLHENNVDLINEKETQQIIEPEHEITNEIQQKPEQNIDIEIVEEFVIDSEIEKKENTETEIEEKNEDKTLTTEKVIITEKPEPEPEPEPEPKPQSQPQLNFFEWLDSIEQNYISEIEETNKETINNNISEEIEQVNKIEENYDPVGWAEIAYEIQAFVKHPEVTNKAPERLSKEKVDDILDNFIKKNPSISKPKAEFYKPENMARKSEDFHAEVVSETLAQLFYKQGLLHKALEMYEKLLLQNPIKKDIFAANIKKIKEELINKL